MIYPTGGINLIANVMILIADKIFNFSKASDNKIKYFSVSGVILSIFIIFAAFGVVAYSAFVLVDNAIFINGTTNCEIVYHEIGQRNIILRVDDVQDYVWYDAQKAIMESALERNLTLVLGIIPSNFLEDKRIYDLVKDNRCNFEIALHGYRHEFEEFKNLDYTNAFEKAKKGLELLKNVEPNIVSFIAPDNVISNEAEDALKSLGIKYISAFNNNSKYGFDVSIYDWKNKESIDYRKLLADCNNFLEAEGICVVMIHPQDFIIDGEFNKEKFDNYLKFLDGIEELNASIINFRDFGIEN